MKAAFTLAIMLALVLGMVLPGCSFTKPDGNASQVKTFDQCAAAGYPVMESYPRQCRTPDGRTFVSDKDRFDIDKNTSCGNSSDCALVDSSFGFGCCFEGQCKAADYSHDSWVAVNAEWFANGQESYCPDDGDCGPAPMCNPKPINANYSASCVAGICSKVALREKCCEECADAYGQSPIAAGPQGAICGHFATAKPLSEACAAFFLNQSIAVSRCGFS